MEKLALYIKKLLHEVAGMNNLHVMPDLVTSHARPDRASYTEQIPGQAGNDRTVKPGMTERSSREFHGQSNQRGHRSCSLLQPLAGILSARCPALLIDFNKPDDKKPCSQPVAEENLAEKVQKV